MSEVVMTRVEYLEPDRAFADGYAVYQITYEYEEGGCRATFTTHVRTSGNDFARAEKAARAEMISLAKAVAASV